ncbi:hypothetical protein [Streptomyces sp. URMC 123]|uniref:hypothetical protein n=1 Tax=Streptomyces sp. URMC 123 TaxID=3423403 RepID=UPI003F1DDC34
MTESISLDRRRLLATALGVAVGGSVLWAAGGPAPRAVAAEAPRATGWSGGTSANGWPVLDGAPTHRIEGAGGVSVAVRDGDVAVVLLHVARRFHYEVDVLRHGDVVGHTTDRDVRQPYESNRLSGTAIAIRPASYPIGAAGGLFPQELVVVRDILAECEGVVAWGGDEKVAKESHFQIDVKPGDPRLTALAAKIRGWEQVPGEGAGTVDAFAPTRRAAAQAFERQSS